MFQKFLRIWNHRENEITPEAVYLNRKRLIPRRELLQKSTLLMGAYAVNPQFQKIDPGQAITKEELALSYNNFYEFSLEKNEVKDKVQSWKLNDQAWKVEITGLVEKPQSLSIAEMVKLAGPEEERIYRFRCVEGWSMVLPWGGFELGKLIRALKPKSNAKYVAFQTFKDPAIGPNISRLPHYPWPYQEGLTMEEAMHPLTILATGLYGKKLPKQSGAPIRLVVPWKYGFKSIKSIVKIEFTDKEPKTLWNLLAPNEYGFYANVNPQVDHPRWSQATERVIDGKFFPTRIPTKLFNGYSEVADLYKNLDLKKFY